MAHVYLDGIQLQKDHARLLMNIMGPFFETCPNCGGSMIEVKKILIHSNETPTIFLTWCITCGRYNRLIQEFPVKWFRGVIGRVTSELSVNS